MFLKLAICPFKQTLSKFVTIIELNSTQKFINILIIIYIIKTKKNGRNNNFKRNT